MHDLLDTRALAAAVSRLAGRRVTPRRLLQLAESRGVAPVRSVGRAHLWAADAAARLVPGRPGRKKNPKKCSRPLDNPADDGIVRAWRPSGRDPSPPDAGDQARQ